MGAYLAKASDSLRSFQNCPRNSSAQSSRSLSTPPLFNLSLFFICSYLQNKTGFDKIASAEVQALHKISHSLTFTVRSSSMKMLMSWYFFFFWTKSMFENWSWRIYWLQTLLCGMFEFNLTFWKAIPDWFLVLFVLFAVGNLYATLASPWTSWQTGKEVALAMRNVKKKKNPTWSL